MASKRGKYLLAGGGLVVAGFAVFLLTQLGASSSEAAPAAPPKAPQAAAMDQKIAALRGAKLPDLHDEPVIVDGVAKINPASDQMYLHLEENQDKQVGMAAGSCYHGGLDKKSRNQRVKMTWTNHVENGVVTVRNLKIIENESNLDDPKMEKCMFDNVAAVAWEDKALPDGDWDDMSKFAPERGLKKYTEENMAYEGDPSGLPVGKAVMTAHQAKPVSDTATQSDNEAATQAGR